MRDYPPLPEPPRLLAEAEVAELRQICQERIAWHTFVEIDTLNMYVGENLDRLMDLRLGRIIDACERAQMVECKQPDLHVFGRIRAVLGRIARVIQQGLD